MFDMVEILCSVCISTCLLTIAFVHIIALEAFKDPETYRASFLLQMLIDIGFVFSSLIFFLTMRGVVGMITRLEMRDDPESPP